jgi:homotetrameric cytidine deaminase
LPKPRRNLEIKARDGDPRRSLELALALGADDQGVIEQRDTYFKGAGGRLKLREQAPVESGTVRTRPSRALPAAELIQYDRADTPGPRASDYRIVPVADVESLRAALDAALGTLVVVEKRRRLLLADGVRIHLDEVAGLGSFVELEAPEGREVDPLVSALQIDPGALVAGSYSNLLLDTPELLLRAAEAAMRNAYAPHSKFKVGAALRAGSGAIYTGANVENAAYPQSQCAEASAIGALVVAGEDEIAAVAVVAEQIEVCPPCGGCRQRLAEFAKPETPVYLGRSHVATLGELLPLSFSLDA